MADAEPIVTYYLGLFRRDPAAPGEPVEIAGGEYRRVPVAFRDAGPAGEDRRAMRPIQETVLPANLADWSTVTHIGLFATPTGGEPLDIQPLEPGGTVQFELLIAP